MGSRWLMCAERYGMNRVSVFVDPEEPEEHGPDVSGVDEEIYLKNHFGFLSSISILAGTL
jgi:hypothetical protein